MMHLDYNNIFYYTYDNSLKKKPIINNEKFTNILKNILLILLKINIHKKEDVNILLNIIYKILFMFSYIASDVDSAHH